jgi:hypothetical protein
LNYLHFAVFRYANEQTKITMKLPAQPCFVKKKCHFFKKNQDCLFASLVVSSAILRPRRAHCRRTRSSGLPMETGQ